MRELRISYENGRPYAAYLYFAARNGQKSVRTVASADGQLIIDYNSDGLPYGIEILAPWAVSHERLNELLSSGQIRQSGIEPCERMRPLTSLLIAPSVDLAELAEQHQREMPYLIQYFVNSLGRDASSSSDLMSYLLFTSKYTSALIDIGYNDASKRIDEIETFLYSSDDGNK